MAAETEAVCCVQLSVHRPNPNLKKKDYRQFLAFRETNMRYPLQQKLAIFYCNLL